MEISIEGSIRAQKSRPISFRIERLNLKMAGRGQSDLNGAVTANCGDESIVRLIIFFRFSKNRSDSFRS